MRPLTENMIRHLRRAREREVADRGNKICTSNDFKGTLSGLYRRGLVNTRKVSVDGKEITAVYITQSGINFLNNFSES